MADVAHRPHRLLEDCNQALQTALEISMASMGNSLSVSGDPLDFLDEEPKSQNVTQCVAVPSSEHVAEIVGRQGCKIKALRARTNTYIKTPVRGEEPVFSISGRPEHVSSAKREILEFVEHLQELKARSRYPGLEDKVSIRVWVPYHIVGLVVGPKGSTVKRIQQLTQTFIVTPSRDKEPYFEVKGTLTNVERAKQEIQKYIALRTKGTASFDGNAEFGGNYVEDNVYSHFHNTTHSLRHAFSPTTSVSTLLYPVNGNSLGLLESNSLEVTSDVTEVSSEGDMHQIQMWKNLIDSEDSAVSTTLINGMRLVRNGSHDVGKISNGDTSVGDVFGGDNTWKSSTNVFSGVQFVPPSTSYQTLSASLLAPNSTSGLKNGRVLQPISPTGSFESNSSDGASAISPRLSPLLLKQIEGTAPGICCLCKAEDENMAALIPCKHNFCQNCAHLVACKSGSCPVCGTQVTNVMRLGNHRFLN